MTTAPEHPQSPESGSALRIGGAPLKPGLPEPSHGTDAPLPHERDQALGQVAKAPDPIIAQAKRDIDAGMVDTDMHATPGLDAERRAMLVPEPTPEPTPEPPLGPDSESARPARGAPSKTRRKPR